MKKDTYAKITDIVIEGLKKKGLNWFKTWVDDAGNEMLPVNHTTGNTYNGINTFILTMTAIQENYSSNEWLGYKQAVALGCKVPKGGTEIFYWIKLYHDKKTDKWLYETAFKKITKGMSQKEIQKRFTMTMSPKSHWVWHIEQVGLDPKHKPEPVQLNLDNDQIEIANAVYLNMKKKPTMSNGGNRAFYRPSAHHVQMPMLEQFKTSDDYYKTMYHELIHSTGHESILKRSGITSMSAHFGSESYSKEELIAEIGAMMLVSKTGLQPTDDVTNSQAYINGWCKHLKDNKKEVMMAASQAVKAVKYILNEKS